MPAPSPISGSAPTAPRWSRFSRILRPCSTIACDFVPGDVGDEADAAGVVLGGRPSTGPGARRRASSSRDSALLCIPMFTHGAPQLRYRGTKNTAVQQTGPDRGLLRPPGSVGAAACFGTAAERPVLHFEGDLALDRHAREIAGREPGAAEAPRAPWRRTGPGASSAGPRPCRPSPCSLMNRRSTTVPPRAPAASRDQLARCRPAAAGGGSRPIEP